jgi:hypothetical protein
MTYYRLALQERQTSMWTWKSTVLTSLEGVLHLLRIYNPIPPERIRVFCSACKEEIQEMLDRENNGQASGSLTAAQFLRDRRLHVRGVSSQQMTEKTIHRSTSVAVDPDMREDRLTSSLADACSINLLDQKRLQIELGSGGDHDIPYRISLPVSTPQLLAWTRLLVRAYAGELQP